MSLSNTNNIYYCEVQEVTDDKGGLRIKVRLPSIDDIYPTNDELPWVFPLLPKFIHCNPKIGEYVFVLLQESGVPSGARFFIGPIISQDYYLNYNIGQASKRLIEGEEIINPPLLQNPSMDENNKGTLLDREDIAIRGRYNSDIILKPKELQMRCCFKDPYKESNTEKSLNYNRLNPAYIQMKYDYYIPDTNKYPQLYNEYGYHTYVNVVADKINLLSHLSNNDNNLSVPDELITETKLNDISWHENGSHPLLYGDRVIEILKGILKILDEHVHPFSTLKPSYNEVDRKLVNFNDWDSLISHNIHIN